MATRLRNSGRRRRLYSGSIGRRFSHFLWDALLAMVLAVMFTGLFLLAVDQLPPSADERSISLPGG